MSAYSIGSDSSRWWWPPATAGAVGAAAIAAILVVPTTGSAVRDRPLPANPPAQTGDPWVTTTDPAIGRRCFALPARWNASLEHGRPSCGHGTVTHQPRQRRARRPGLDSRP
jgi:hypothetical protein